MSTEITKCQNCKTQFTPDPDDLTFYERIKVPAPTFCPQCRLIRRLIWRNHRSLYKRSCNLCSKSIITMYSDTDPAPVLCNDCWNSDNWDAKSDGFEIDWTKSFFAQWYELFQKVPRLLNYRGGTLVNSDFTNYSVNNKDTYLSFSVIDNENVMYCDSVDRSRDTMDCTGGQSLDQCSHNVNSESNFNCHYVVQVRSCVDCLFLFDCTNCQNCCLSSNLRNQQYVFLNKKVGKEEYQRLVAELSLSTNSGLEHTKKKFNEMKQKGIARYANIYASKDATGEFIHHSNNVRNSFGVYEGENIKNTFRIIRAKDVYDCGGVLDGELEYESLAGSIQSSSIFFSVICLTCNNLEYSIFCRNCSDCFGCIQLKDSQYCIFNKQYTKEEYEELVPKIKEHMNAMPYQGKAGALYKYGEFFPFEFCPWGYNETMAHTYFPLTEKEATERKYNWKDRGQRLHSVTVSSDKIPENINDVTDDILKETIECAHKGSCNHQCTNAFKIYDRELVFLKQKKFPLPRLCPNCRHYERIALQPPMQIWHRQCMCEEKNHGHSHVCSNEFETSYAPDRPEKVYCETCYQKEVF